MYIIIQATPTLLGIFNIIVIPPSQEIEAEIVRFARVGLDTYTHDKCQNFIANLHHLFLQNGDTDENRNHLGADIWGWYMASCECCLLQLREYELQCCQVGTIHACLDRPEFPSLIAPIHNLQSELIAHTIEQSCLAPFETRSNTEIAQQILRDLPQKYLKELVSLPREEFCEKLGHFATRVVGYFPDSQATEFGVYRQTPPIPAALTVNIEKRERILIYVPDLHLMSYHYDQE
ncbi:MAG TPA: hypothetical protein VHO69_02435, partial [Phototrophicaceae bacterium]|nr:hypothetical protein [Phototrophicaceae bacterium]